MKAESSVNRTKGSPVYPAVTRAIQKLGQDISLARRSRRISADNFARSMGVSRGTLYRLEKGDAGIGINTLAMALSALGRLDLLENLVDHTKDDVGLMALRQEVPTRISKSRPKKGLSVSESSDPIISDEGTEGW
jgi:transcriptional regulator with XRE-family HTH domain